MEESSQSDVSTWSVLCKCIDWWQCIHHHSSKVGNLYVIEVKFLDVNLLTYFSEIMAISEDVGRLLGDVVFSGPATVLPLNRLLSREKSTLNYFSCRTSEELWVHRLVPSSGKKQLSLMSICPRNTLKPSSRAAYLYPCSSVFPGRQGARNQNKGGKWGGVAQKLSSLFFPVTSWIALHRHILVAFLTLQTVLLPAAF